MQTANVTATSGKTTISDLAAAATLTLAGAASSSAVDLGQLGGANNYDLNLTATGLKAGLSVGDMAVNTGYNISANVSGVTGAVSFTDSLGDTQGDSGAAVAKNVTITATGLGGKLTTSSIYGSGDVTVSASGAKEASVANGGTITGGTVTVDVSGTTVTSVVGTTINAKSAVTLTLHELAATANYTIGSVSGSTGLAVKLTGGVSADNFTINGIATTTSIAVTGDLAADDDTITINSSLGTAAQTISISGLKDYKTATITGGSGADTISGGAGADLIYGGLGANVLSGGAGADAFFFNSGESTATSVNTITDLGSTDIIYFGGATATIQTAAITATNVSISTKGVATFTGTATLYDTLAEKMDLIDAQVASGKIVFFTHESNTYMMVDANSSTVGGDVVVLLTGVQLTAVEGTGVATTGSYGSLGATGLVGLTA